MSSTCYILGDYKFLSKKIINNQCKFHNDDSLRKDKKDGRRALKSGYFKKDDWSFTNSSGV